MFSISYLIHPSMKKSIQLIWISDPFPFDLPSLLRSQRCWKFFSWDLQLWMTVFWTLLLICQPVCWSPSTRLDQISDSLLGCSLRDHHGHSMDPWCRSSRTCGSVVWLPWASSQSKEVWVSWSWSRSHRDQPHTRPPSFRILPSQRPSSWSSRRVGVSSTQNCRSSPSSWSYLTAWKDPATSASCLSKRLQLLVVQADLWVSLPSPSFLCAD